MRDPLGPFERRRVIRRSLLLGVTGFFLYLLAPGLVEPDRMDQALSYKVRPGLIARPAPGTILHFGDDEGDPVFDAAKSKKYTDAMVESVLAAIQEALDGWATNLGEG